MHAVIRAMHPRKVFRISRGARTEITNVFVRITARGVSGYGEASPSLFYGESAAGVLARLEAARPLVEALEIETPGDIALAWSDLWPVVSPSRAAQCALDIALWDWLARSRGQTVAELALGRLPGPVKSFCTIGLSDYEELDEKVRELHGFPAIKIKSGTEASLDPIRFVRERVGPGPAIAVDANCSWAEADIPMLSGELSRLGVVFLEQPLPPEQNGRMPALAAASRVPIMADESCVLQEDVEQIKGVFAGFNIKLVKCGGLTPALAMLRRGRELGLRVMVGCMLESSLLISAGAVIAQATDYADLDGSWLLADDPFVVPGTEAGLPLSAGILSPGAGTGFGVEPVEGLFQEF